jgi:CheY-like chemotaxis protein
MDGDIGAVSTVGVGSVFWVELNSTDAALAFTDAVEPSLPVLSPTAATTQCTLLYIEDNPANLMLIEDIISRRSDIRLLNARDGIRGVEMALKFMPDLILMDINLPGISGVQALEILAQLPATAHIPVVALSANALPRDIAKGLESGFFRYLTKPIKIDKFMHTLDETLKFAKAKSASAHTLESAL